MSGNLTTLRLWGAALVFLVLWVSRGAAIAAISISSAPTANMSCAAGICTPTSKKAVLNVDDLETMLAAGSVSVSTTGSGVQAEDVEIDGSLGWGNSSTLTLDAYRSVSVAQPILVSGQGGLSVRTNDGGSGGRFYFGPRGHVEFADLSSTLAIDGISYTLENSIASLAAAISANPSGAYALATDYDAAADGVYKATPIPTDLSGAVEGLGNAISNLKMHFKSRYGGTIALFASTDTSGRISDLRLSHIEVRVNKPWKSSNAAGGLVIENYGTVSGDEVSGAMTGLNCGCSLAGLVLGNYGMIDHSSADVKLSTLGLAGGLVGGNSNSIASSHASGSISAYFAGGLISSNAGPVTDSFSDATVVGGDYSVVGGLIGADEIGLISNSYATGSVTGGKYSYIGGLEGEATGGGTLEFSYATGEITGGTSSFIGGLIGFDDTVYFSDCYWDTDTTGTSEGTGGGNKSGLTGLTSEQLQSGLPQGFSKKIWAEKGSLNSGFPYLTAIPPNK
jgi:hypothetical protein